MNDATAIERALDAVAESLVLLDPGDATSVNELCDAIASLVTAWGAGASADAPCCVALRAAQRLAAGDGDAITEIEEAFVACRRQAAAPRSSAPVSATEGTESGGGAPVAEGAAGEPPTAADQKQPIAATMPLSGDEELLADFAVRAAEHLDDADERLLALESNPADTDAADAVFRAFHTIKGMAGFLGLDDVSVHAHDSEALLAETRSSGAAVTDETVQALFSAVDTMRVLLARIMGAPQPVVEGGPLAEQPAATELDTASPAPPAASSDTSAAPASASPSTAENASARAGTVRVEEARLDALLDAIGEMVIAESMVSAAMRSGTDQAVVDVHLDRLDKITRELQQMATSLRMVPLRATFRRMARLVRDVAAKGGKHVDFVISGEDTEIDKDVVDRISDPLVHALRNAVDHGIETPEERRAAGKPEVGRVELRAFHAGGAIHVEVADDGRGLDVLRILDKARERGLVGAEEVLDERAALDLVFAPGFSTAGSVTDVSGRGVGMDVVRRTVEELRGRVELRSAPGEGTVLAVRLPLTLAIIDGMVLRVGQERYVVPLLSIERSVRPRAEEVHTVAGRAEMIAHGDGLVPVVRLHRHFSAPGAVSDMTEGVVVVVNDNGTRAGLMACELLGQQQTVIKPLGDGLGQQPGVAGGAVMPDGRVGLILDAAGLVRAAHEAGGR